MNGSVADPSRIIYIMITCVHLAITTQGGGVNVG